MLLDGNSPSAPLPSEPLVNVCRTVRILFVSSLKKAPQRHLGSAHWLVVPYRSPFESRNTGPWGAQPSASPVKEYSTVNTPDGSISKTLPRSLAPPNLAVP